MADESRVVTVPNALSLVRLACLPLFLWLLFGVHNRVAASLVLAGLGATDWVDGYVARRFDQVSTVGKVLDPAADRILLGGSVIAILIDGSVPAFLAWATIVREILISAAVISLAAMRAPRIDVQWAGKAGTLGLMVSFPLFLLGHSSVAVRHVANLLGWCFGVPGLILAWYAAITYLPRARYALAEARVGSAPMESR